MIQMSVRRFGIVMVAVTALLLTLGAASRSIDMMTAVLVTTVTQMLAIAFASVIAARRPTASKA
jgi:hypothetical protein